MKGWRGGFVEDGDITEPDVGEETVVVVCNKVRRGERKSPFMQYLIARDFFCRCGLIIRVHR